MSETQTSDLIARGATWTVLGQLAPMVVTLFLTPYIIHGLGVTRYGLFTLIGSLVTLISTFDGGARGTALRYFGVYAGRDDRRMLTRLLMTLLAALTVAGALLGVAGWFAASPIVHLLRMPADLRPQAIFLFRTLGVLIAFSFFHATFAGIVTAFGRYPLITKAGMACYVVWAAGLFLTVHFGWGLRGIAAVFLAQQALLALTVMPASLSYVTLRHAGFLNRAECHEFLHISIRVQLSGISSLINTEFDNILIGSILTVRSVAFYDSGINFSRNVASVVTAVLAPAQTALANTYGRDGEAATIAMYRRLQHLWVVGLTGWFAAAGGAAYFAIVAWLGPRFGLAGMVALIGLLTQMLLLFVAVLSGLCIILGKPGPYSRAGLFSVAANLVFTIPLLAFGASGVAAGTCIGQLFAVCYLVRAARKKVSGEIPNLLASLSVLPGLLTAATVVVLELLIRNVIPEGGLGLLACAVPAMFGLLLFAVMTAGPRRSVRLLLSGCRRARANGPVAAVAALLSDALVADSTAPRSPPDG